MFSAEWWEEALKNIVSLVIFQDVIIFFEHQAVMLLVVQ
jgi:hypothetical protein